MVAYRQIDIQTGIHLVNNHFLAQGYSYKNLKMFIFFDQNTLSITIQYKILCKKVKQHFTHNHV